MKVHGNRLFGKVTCICQQHRIIRDISQVEWTRKVFIYILQVLSVTWDWALNPCSGPMPASANVIGRDCLYQWKMSVKFFLRFGCHQTSAWGQECYYTKMSGTLYWNCILVYRKE